MREIAKEFGDAQLVRYICDRPGCGKPITLCWTGGAKGGPEREYCSKQCYREAERMGWPAPEPASGGRGKKPEPTRRSERERRRTTIRVFRASFLKKERREPSVTEVESELEALGIAGSRRTIWKDLEDVRNPGKG
jgi:hypothetical protein